MDLRRLRCGIVALLVLLLAHRAGAQDVDAALRTGIYADSDHTQVYRSLAAASANLGHFSLGVQEEVDVVTSASVDVRTSPFVDSLTGASKTTPKMNDRRFETSVNGRWNDGAGHGAGLSAVYATELDYTSLALGGNGSWELGQRNTTLSAGANVGFNSVGSVTDSTFHRSLHTVGYSAGVGQVLSPRDIARVRYDGSWLDGYQASPYRSVRFGDWSVSSSRRSSIMTFSGTIGPASGLPEVLPQTRLRHAAGLEWVHGFSPAWATVAGYRLGYDDWGVLAHTATLELRWAGPACLVRIGYRFYLQSAADFFEEKYVLDPSAYRYYTSDKELGEERGHSGVAELGWTAWRSTNGQSSLTLDVRAEAVFYSYPDFALLASRTSGIGEVGMRLHF
jgi:hypothetical protein